MATKEKTAKFVVVKKHTLDFEVGQVVELTANQARSLVGKIRLKKDMEDETKTAKSLAEAEEKIAELEAALDKAQADLAEATKGKK